ncbi:glycine oxidase ThiO [Nitrosovibrio tenuis]|uniref:Glycine oxidase n=1 Tax=Nitrosovibrio tenuis TaxID=1233 RepID=A0A1H7LHB6_9PROT|nr:glycine oxidase ThiO [Nitrosovibrio tenuis]SEK98342.1 glycine oxidase [Nitrosovibrio tenuis]
MSSDVIVIGGGIAGLATAHELIRSGASVTILERSRCGLEASWAGAGILSPLLPWDYPQSVARLAQLSNSLFPEFIEALTTETGIDPEYQASGMLVLPELLPESSGDAKGLRQDARNQMAEDWCGRNAFPMTRVRSREIARALARDQEAFWLPGVCQVRNPRLLQALIRAVNLAGGKIVEHTAVAGLRVERGRTQSISTSQGDEYSADHYIVAAGPWSRQLLGEHALKLDIWPVRGQILLFKAQPGLLDTILLQEWDYFYLIPRHDGHILAGSTLEEAGFDKSPTTEARQILLAKAHALVPALTEETVSGHWAGLRPGSPANIPVIDRHPSISNLYLNSGHYRYGVTMAPGSARLLSNIILDKPQPVDVTPYQWPR